MKQSRWLHQKWWIWILMLGYLLCSSTVAHAAKKDCFVKQKGYLYYYDENGDKLKRQFKEVDGSTYYFGKKGHMTTGWLEYKKDYYYFDRKNGKMQKNKQVDGITLQKDGKAKKTKWAVSKIKTMIKAKKVVSRIVEPTDSKKEKISKCCKWVMKWPYKQHRRIKPIMNQKGWEMTFANDMFDHHDGCCVSNACALAFLFKEIGLKDVSVCHDTGHAWCDYHGRVYDTLFAEAKSKRYLNMSYKSYYAKRPMNKRKI